MPVRTDLANSLRKLGSAKVTINSATTTNFDFGTPNDLDLASLANYTGADRLLVVFTATTTGTTDTVSFSIQDAPDSGGSIGTPATATTHGTLTGGTGDQVATADVTVDNASPWIRCRVTSTGSTDTFVATAVVYAVDGAMV